MGREPASNPDSDDEQVPGPPVVKPFTESELALVQSGYEDLCEAVQVGRGVRFSYASVVKALQKS